MHMTTQPTTQVFMGALLLALVTVESGGYFLTRVMRGLAPANALQVSFFRAGHAHAGVLLVLSLVILSVLDGTDAGGAWGLVARVGVPLAAILMPAGFFLSVLGKDPQRPSGLLALVWLGAGSLTVGLIGAGLALIAAGSSAMQ
jgi:hypothetical protein